MTLQSEIEAGKGGDAPLKRFSRPYVPRNTTKEATAKTNKLVEEAMRQDREKLGAEEHQRRIKEKIREDLERAQKLRREELEKGEMKIKRMDRREAEGKDPLKQFSTDEEDDGVDNTVLMPPSTPDPRNASFGRPLSTDYRLNDAQRDFEASGMTRAVVWRPNTESVKAGGAERAGEEGVEEEQKRDHTVVEEEERNHENYVENMKIVYEGVEKEALTVRDMLEKTGADPDSRRELVVLAAQLIEVNEQLICEKEEESRKHVRDYKGAKNRSRSMADSSRSKKDEERKRAKSSGSRSSRSSFRQVRASESSSAGEDN